MDYSHETQIDTLSSLTGGPELIARSGNDPSFHDAELVSLHLAIEAPSVLKVKWLGGCFVFTLDGVIDVDLDHFAPYQTAFHEIKFYRAPPQSRRQPSYGAPGSPADIVVEIEPHMGLGGTIRCQSISIAFVEEA